MVRRFDTPGNKALRRGRHPFVGGIYHITTATRGRAPVFRDFECARAAAASIASPASIGDASLLAWVLMPDHLHMLLQLGADRGLSPLVGRIKARSAKAVQHVTGCKGAVWAKGYHDRALRREDDLRDVVRYIIANPLRAGLVRRCGDYPFWDAVYLSPTL